ncbi:interleukin-13 isoform X1 [Oryctolagus cuniculus]|uniref:interleukin-13 isoform X1 n=1 Tax=Oryctolagus cuniculus TaxID=9986 RepID=UPI00387A3FCF
MALWWAVAIAVTCLGSLVSPGPVPPPTSLKELIEELVNITHNQKAPLCNGTMVWSVNLTGSVVRTHGQREGGRGGQVHTSAWSLLSLAHTAEGIQADFKSCLLCPHNSGLPPLSPASPKPLTHAVSAPQYCAALESLVNVSGCNAIQRTQRMLSGLCTDKAVAKQVTSVQARDTKIELLQFLKELRRHLQMLYRLGKFR